MKNKAIFLDRDGVINKDLKYIFKKEDFEFIEGVLDSLKKFLKKNFLLIIVTNQSGIAKGHYTLEDYKQLTEWYLNELKQKKINITEVFFCPHNPEDSCLCRKPKPYFIKLAQKKYNLDLKKCFMVGDKQIDLDFAKNANIKAFKVKKNKPNELLKTYDLINNL